MYARNVAEEPGRLKDDNVSQFHFEGSLTTRDGKRHIPHRFVAPADAGQIDIHLRIAPEGSQGMKHLITLTVFDPAGFRGAGHRGGSEHRVRIAAAETTPGYLPGPLPAGEWIVQLDTHRIMPGEPVHYWLDVEVQTRAAAPDADPSTSRGLQRPETDQGLRSPELVRAVSRTTPRGPGWYRGDLHTHTHHSDAQGRSVADLIELARGAGLDFIFLTDHNTTAGLAEADAAGEDGLLVAAGIELTTFWGHALCLGRRDWVDWRIRPGTGEIAAIAAETYAAGQVFIIAHPQSNGDPGCTGCAWRFGDMMPGAARLVEIWNGPWAGDSNNEASLALWYDWLNQGYRLAATAGSDTHSQRNYANRPGFNVLYAAALTEAALLDALLAGHLYVSAGPQISFQAVAHVPGTCEVPGTSTAERAGGETWISGDTATGPATFTLAWADCPAAARVRVIVDGKLLAERPAAPGDGSHTWRMMPADAHWVLAEIRGDDGQMLAVTNPIFFQ